MPQSVLVYIDIDHIQEYIFGSNDLAQNVGASELVRQATGDDSGGWLQQIKTSSDGRIIYAGGGNAALLFDTPDAAQREIRALTYRALKDAPGMQMAVHTQAMTYSAQSNDLKDHIEHLRQASRERPTAQSMPQLGLSVSAACPYTAWPVAGLEETEREPVSRVVLSKRRATDAGNQRLRTLIGNDARFDFVRRFDDFGTPDESSYIALIHADGNGMSERFRAITGSDNETYIQHLRAFSESINIASDHALRATINKLQLSYDEAGLTFGRPGFKARSRRGKTLLPFRPIVFGGDDVTFVADGRLGLELAATYLTELRNAPLLTDQQPLYACAGVAVAHVHFPFSRVYELADELTSQAKSLTKAKNDRSMVGLDWHFSTSGIIEDLERIRQREYRAENDGNLLLRPVTLGQTDTGWRSYETFRYLTDRFKHHESWEGRRNKVKALRQALREGADAVSQFRVSYNMDLLPGLDQPPGMAVTGWADISDSESTDLRCGYFDAIEAMDFFTLLQPAT